MAEDQRITATVRLDPHPPSPLDHEYAKKSIQAIGRAVQEGVQEAGLALSDAQTADGQAFAREYADTVGTYLRERKELDEPGLTPGAPHPDQPWPPRAGTYATTASTPATPTANSKQSRRRADAAGPIHTA